MFETPAGITRRQLEFLRAAHELDAAGEGAHYEQVASRLGVSKWTAYDVLRRLSRAGFVAPVYRTPREGGGGRARVCFQVTALGRDVIQAGGAEAGWDGTRDWLLRVAGEGEGSEQAVRHLREKLPQASRPVLFCLSFVALLLFLLRESVRGSEATWVMGYLVPALQAASTSAPLIAGAALGLLLAARGGRSAAVEVLAWLPRYAQEARALDAAGDRAVGEFARQLARSLWAPAESKRE